MIEILNQLNEFKHELDAFIDAKGVFDKESAIVKIIDKYQISKFTAEKLIYYYEKRFTQYEANHY